jgi:Fungal protein kinase
VASNPTHALIILSIILQEPHDFIRLWTGMAVANELGLGFDPTIQRIIINDTQRYRIPVDGKFYVTCAILSDDRASSITGRATRVFEVYDEDDPDTTVALKDLWMDDGSTSEGDILSEVFRAMQEWKNERSQVSPDEDRDVEDDDYHRFFFTTVAHGLVKFDDSSFDNTRAAMHGRDLPQPMEYYTTKPGDEYLRTRESQTSSHSRSHGSMHGPIIVPRTEPRPIRHLQHYRIVFKEVGRPVYDLDSLREVFEMLLDAAKGQQDVYNDRLN